MCSGTIVSTPIQKSLWAKAFLDFLIDLKMTDTFASASIPPASPLLTDMYQVTMAAAYFNCGKHNDPASFELFFRNCPFGVSFYFHLECLWKSSHFCVVKQLPRY
jgi:hypothetical protein